MAERLRRGAPMPGSRSRHRFRLARPLSERAEASAVSHSYVDIGLAPQVTKVPPRDRIQPLAYQRFGDVLARVAFPPDGRFSADHDHADPVFLYDRRRHLSDRQSVDYPSHFR